MICVCIHCLHTPSLNIIDPIEIPLQLPCRPIFPFIVLLNSVGQHEGHEENVCSIIQYIP